MRKMLTWAKKCLQRSEHAPPFVKCVVVVSAVASIFLVYSLYSLLGNLVAIEQHRTESIQIARELRTSSRELTHAAQTFVTTGKAASEKKYYDVLQVRMGEAPRPTDQSIAPGERKPLMELFKDRVTPEEYELLQAAMGNSILLTALEQEAMNASKGLFLDSRGRYAVRGAPDPQMAFDMLLGDSYQHELLSVMAPLDEFFARVSQRIDTEVQDIQDRALMTLLLTCITMVVFFSSLLGASYYSAVRKDMRNIRTFTSYACIVLVLLAAISVPAWVTYSDARNDFVAAMEKRQSLLCREIYRELQLRIAHSMELVTLASLRPPVVRFMNAYEHGDFSVQELRAAQEVLQSFSLAYNDSQGMFLVDSFGIVTASSSPQEHEGTYTSLLPARALLDIHNGKSTIVTIHQGGGSQPLIAIPVRQSTSRNSKILGAVVMVMELQNNGNLWDGRLASEEQMSIFVLDSAASVVLSSNTTWKPGMDTSQEPAGKFVLTGKEGLQSYIDGLGSARLGVYMKLPELGWTVVVSSDEERILAPVHSLLTRSVLLSSVAILTAIALVTLLLIRLMKNTRRSEERLTMVIDGAGIGIWDVDLPTDTFTHNEFWAQLSGLAPQKGSETLGWAIGLCYEEDRPLLQGMLDSLIFDSSDVANEGKSCECRTYNGQKWCWRKITARVVDRDKLGKALRISGTTMDIHARKMEEMTASEKRQELEDMVRQRTCELEEVKNQALDATQAKTAFLSTVSHEIRTPMNAIIGFIHLFNRKNLEARQLSYLNKMHLAANALLLIINDVLDISKIEARKMELEAIPFLLSPVLDGAKSIVGFAVREKKLTLTVDIAPDVPVAVQGDPTRIQQILLNLLSNAVKFTQSGNVGLSVKVVANATALANTPEHADIRTLLFSVTDTGIGMSEEQVTKLFQPFVQADASVSREFGGTGLGLAICKQLTELMGGTIRVESTYHRGTSFLVSLPLRVVDAAQVHHADDVSARRRKERAAGTSLRVLVVDDNDINLEVAKAMLEAEGLLVEVAIDGLEAVEKVTTQSFDAVFMDMQMPVMDGLEATRKIRALALKTGAEALLHLPIIAMTANAMVEDRKLCLEAGMSDHLTKPIEPARLHELLDTWLALP